MSLTACRNCGAAVPGRSYTCPKCGAGMASGSPAPPRSPEERSAGTAPAAPAAYRPPPRPPEEPERFRWTSAVGWVAGLAVLALIGTFLYRLSGEVDERATQEAEVARENDHAHKAMWWVQDTSGTTPPPESGPAPTTSPAKRMWVVRRMVVERAVWEQEIRTRHNARAVSPPAAWATAKYQADARSYPEVGRYLQGRAAAAAEILQASAGWMDQRTAALAREAGLSFAEVRVIFPRDLRGVPEAEARFADAMLALHRHLVSIDPRVRHAGEDQLIYEREDDIRRGNQLAAQMREAADAASHARRQWLAGAINALPNTRAIQVD